MVSELKSTHGGSFEVLPHFRNANITMEKKLDIKGKNKTIFHKLNWKQCCSNEQNNRLFIDIKCLYSLLSYIDKFYARIMLWDIEN